MAQANTDELTNTTPTADQTAAMMDEQDLLAQELTASADAQDPQTPSEPQTAPEITVTHVGPELVEPTPPKDIRLPDSPEIRRILQLQVPMIVRLAEKIMPLGDILQWAPGAIIEFNKLVGEDLDLMINNKQIGGGQAVKVGEKFGLKVTNLATLEQMIRAMAGR